MGLIRDAVAGAITGGMSGGLSGAGKGALEGAAGMPVRKKRGTDISGAGSIPGQEEYSDEGSGEGAKRPNGKRSNGKSRG